MKTPSQVMSICQGEYSWGIDGNNCLVTIEFLAKEYLPNYKPIYTRWLEMTEPESWRTAIKEYGSLFECHKYHLLRAGLVQDAPPYRPSDLVVSSSVTSRVDGAEWDGRDGRELILFVDDGHRLLYWGPDGLQPVRVSEKPTMLFRFPGYKRV